MKKSKILLLLFCAVGLLTGCGLSKQEQDALEDFSKEAKKYYEEKYESNASLERYGYAMLTDSLFSSRTEDMYAEFSDGVTVYYDADREYLLDSGQGEEVSEALEEAFSERLEELTQGMEEGSFVIEDVRFSIHAEGYEEDFYHTYYKGDIEKVIERENIPLWANLFLICEREDNWQETRLALEQLLREDFPALDNVRLAVMSRSCYASYTAGTNRHPGIDMLECYAEYEIAEETACYMQHYIKLAEGIYATSKEKNFILEEGDITLREAISQDELNEMIYEHYDSLPDVAEENKGGSYHAHDKEHVTYYEVTADTPIWQIRFSERIKEHFGEEFNVYLRFVPEELGLGWDKKFYYFPNDGKKHFHCYAIYTDKADAEFATLNEEDYYFGGTQEKQERE